MVGPKNSPGLANVTQRGLDRRSCILPALAADAPPTARAVTFGGCCSTQNSRREISALQGRPREDESFEIREKIPQAREECSGRGAGPAKGSREEAMGIEGRCRDLADRKEDPNSKQLNHL